LQHPWILANIASASVVEKDVILKSLRNIGIFKNIEKLKKAVLAYIATQLNEKETNSMKQMFSQIDKNQDGFITMEELQSTLSKCKSKVEIEEIMKTLDMSSTGKINYSEFLAASMDHNVFLKKEYLVNAFNEFDKDKNGKITSSELKDILGKDTNISASVWDDMIKAADTNGDGVIDFDEFMAMMYDLKKQYSVIKS
jgi:calcium-dependent protein kinase